VVRRGQEPERQEREVSKILVVEDDRAVRDVVEQSLCKEGLQTAGVADGEEALRYLRESNPIDVVVLDLMLPGEIDGYSVCREIREGTAGEANKDLPVVMLTARDDETSVVVGLEVGADNYVTKPFRIRELVSRVRARLRRQRLSDRAEQQRLEFPGLQMDLLKRLVFSGGESVELMAMEFDMPALIASHPGRVYDRQQIMRCLYEGSFYGEGRSADVHIQHLRKR